MGRSKKTGTLRTAVLVGVAGALALTGAVVSAPTATADTASAIAPTPYHPVPLSQAGEAKFFGPVNQLTDPVCCGVTFGVLPQPDVLDGVAVSQVLFGNNAGLALTAAGKVVGWGNSYARLERIPEAVSSADVVQIATGQSYAGAVTADGRVLTWGIRYNWTTTLDVPEELTEPDAGVVQLAIAGQSAVALKSDGSVIAWGGGNGGSDAELNEVPAELAPGGSAKAVAIATPAGQAVAFALTDQGTVITWGHNAPTLPPETQIPGSVKALVAGGLALLTNGSLISFDGARIPASVQAVTPVAISGDSGLLGVLDDTGAIHGWDSNSTAESPQPEDLGDGSIVQFALAALSGSNGLPDSQDLPGAVIITKMLRAAPPVITGTPKVGSTLTGTAGTFSDDPDQVTNQWLADGSPLAGATGATLTVTSALVGKKISYQSTATKTGQDTISSVSDATAAVAKPAPPKPVVVGSKTTVLKVTVAKKAKRVTVTGKVAASKSPAGKAKVTIKKGKKVIVTKTVRVSSSGALKLAVKKFAKLVAKKLHKKGKKAKKAYKGKYRVTIAYTGASQVKPSTGSKAFKVKR